MQKEFNYGDFAAKRKLKRTKAAHKEELDKVTAENAVWRKKVQDIAAQNENLQGEVNFFKEKMGIIEEGSTKTIDEKISIHLDIARNNHNSAVAYMKEKHGNRGPDMVLFVHELLIPFSFKELDEAMVVVSAKKEKEKAKEEKKAAKKAAKKASKKVIKKDGKTKSVSDSDKKSREGKSVKKATKKSSKKVSKKVITKK